MKTLSTLLLQTILFALFLLSINQPLQAQFPQMGNDIDGEAAGDKSGYSVSLSANGTVMAIGAPYNIGNGSGGHVRVYQWNGTAWIQRGVDIDGEGSGDKSGYSVSLSANGDVLAIGAIYNIGVHYYQAGHVRVYQWNGSAWIQRGVDIDGESGNDKSGTSVSLSANGDVLAIGAPNNAGSAPYAGHVRVYHWNGTAWMQRGLDIDGEAASDFSGWSVSLNDNGDVLAIGAPNNIGIGYYNAGHVRVYQWNGSAWVQKGLDIDGETSGEQSGNSVNLNANGDILAIGAPKNDGNGQNAGHVRVYQWNGSAWVQKGLDIDGEAAYDFSGSSVSLSANGDILAIGAPYNDGNGDDAGHVRVYQWNGAAWVQRGLDIDGEAIYDESGYSVCLSANGDILAIGAPSNYQNGLLTGHMRVYSLKGVGGYAYQDYNQNCLQDSIEIAGIPNQTFILQPGNISVQSNENGWWSIDSLPTGSYTVMADTTQANWELTCPATQSFTITNPDSIHIAPAFGFISNNPCPSPTVSLHAPFLRPGFSNQLVYVQACNDYAGSYQMDSVYVVVALDSLLMVDTASLAYSSLGNNQYQVYLADSLYPGQCVNFWLSTTLSTNAILGQSLCMEATIYPVNPCVLDTVPNTNIAVPCMTPYDDSHLIIRASCINNDSVSFIITNLGDGNMTCQSEVRLFIDGQVIWLDSIQLLSGEQATFNFLGDGRTWRMEVDQHPLHPGNSQPNATIELCGSGAAWTPNLVNILPQDDADPINDIFCGEVRGSYDPNDKTGFPLGVSTDHNILANQKIEYLIRFQNTGTDTAFNITIRDTLSAHLDIFSVVSGVSSHDYSFKIHGPRVLEWTFNNIILPDSNANEPLSHGFVKFEVEQEPDLPLGTLIENTAAIYFDFNAPIITNTYFHTIKEDVYSLSVSVDEPLVEDMQVLVHPNPFSHQTTIEVQGKDYQQLQLLVYDMRGQKVVQQSTASSNRIQLSRGNLTAGVYVYQLLGDEQLINTGKIVVK